MAGNTREVVWSEFAQSNSEHSLCSRKEDGAFALVLPELSGAHAPTSLPSAFSPQAVLSPTQVTLIPTHYTEVTREWYQQTHEQQQQLNVLVLASSSTVVMQDESFPACKIEF